LFEVENPRIELVMLNGRATRNHRPRRTKK
jgi:hypothetical protein